MATLHPDSIAIQYLLRHDVVELFKQSSRKQILMVGTPYHVPSKQFNDHLIPFNQIEYFENFDKEYGHLLPEIRCGDIKVVFIMSDAWNTCNRHETHLTYNGNFLTLDIYNLLYRKVTELGIKEHSVFSTPSSTTDLEQHDDWPAIPFTEPFNRYFDFQKFSPFTPKSGNFKYRYLWLNRRSRAHRIYALHQAFRLKMMDKAKYTFHNFNEVELGWEHFKSELNVFLEDDEIDLTFLKYQTNAVDPQYRVKNDDQDIPELVQLGITSEQCALEIVSEFNCSNNKSFLTEKVSRSIVMGNPFIILGDANSLSELHRMGFKTFDKWIDESYDSILNAKDRMDAGLLAARQFTLEYYDDELNDVLEYNYNHYFGGYKRQQIALAQGIFK